MLQQKKLPSTWFKEENWGKKYRATERLHVTLQPLQIGLSFIHIYLFFYQKWLWEWWCYGILLSCFSRNPHKASFIWNVFRQGSFLNKACHLKLCKFRSCHGNDITCCMSGFRDKVKLILLKLLYFLKCVWRRERQPAGSLPKRLEWLRLPLSQVCSQELNPSFKCG